MKNAALANNQGDPRGNSISLLALTDPIFQNEATQKGIQQNGNTSNVNNKVNKNLTKHPDKSVQLLSRTNIITPQFAGKNSLEFNSEENNIFSPGIMSVAMSSDTIISESAKSDDNNKNIEQTSHHSFQYDDGMIVNVFKYGSNYENASQMRNPQS